MKSILNNFLDKFFNLIASIFVFLTQSYVGVLCFLLLGVFLIKKSLKDNNTDIISNYIRGWVAGVGSIILSFIILYIKLTGQI